MITWRLGTFYEKNPIALDDNDIAGIKSEYYSGDESGYQEHTIPKE